MVKNNIIITFGIPNNSNLASSSRFFDILSSSPEILKRYEYEKTQKKTNMISPINMTGQENQRLTTSHCVAVQRKEEKNQAFTLLSAAVYIVKADIPSKTVSVYGFGLVFAKQFDTKKDNSAKNSSV